MTDHFHSNELAGQIPAAFWPPAEVCGVQATGQKHTSGFWLFPVRWSVFGPESEPAIAEIRTAAAQQLPAETSSALLELAGNVSLPSEARFSVQCRLQAALCLLDADQPIQAWSQIQRAIRENSELPALQALRPSELSGMWRVISAGAAGVGDFTLSQEWCHRAISRLRTRSEQGCCTAEDLLECADLLSICGFIRMRTGRMRESRSALHTACRLHLEGTDAVTAAADLYLLAQVELSLEDRKQAAASCSLAQKLLATEHAADYCLRRKRVTEACIGISRSFRDRSDSARGVMN